MATQISEKTSSSSEESSGDSGAAEQILSTESPSSESEKADNEEDALTLMWIEEQIEKEETIVQQRRSEKGSVIAIAQSTTSNHPAFPVPSENIITIIQKAVKEANLRAQESIKEFYQPTAEELIQIRRGSRYIARRSKVTSPSTSESDSGSPKQEPVQLQKTDPDKMDVTKAVLEEVAESISRVLNVPLHSRYTDTSSLNALKLTDNEYDSDSLIFDPQIDVEDSSGQKGHLAVHPNGRYADEADDFYEPRFTRQKVANSGTQTPRSSDSLSASPQSSRASGNLSQTIYTNSSGTLSEGEIRCRCSSSSLGEIHLCRYVCNCYIY